MPRLIVFDVNETLLDLAALDPLFERAFGEAGVRHAWFAEMLRSAFVATITNVYTDFGTLGQAALEVTAKQHDVTLSDDDRAAILGGMQTLPPHPEVPAALQRLHDTGLRMAALTNSTQAVADAQLSHAGLHALFEQVLSVEEARRLKPAPDVYHLAAQRLGMEASHLRLVAAHNWDITGAMRAGWAGAFVARPGKLLGPLDEQPDIIGPDMNAVVTLILDKEAGKA